MGAQDRFRSAWQTHLVISGQGFDLRGRSGSSIVISNFRHPGSSVVGVLRSATEAADRLRYWTDPETGEVVEREVVIEAIAASTQDTPEGAVHA